MSISCSQTVHSLLLTSSGSIGFQTMDGLASLVLKQRADKAILFASLYEKIDCAMGLKLARSLTPASESLPAPLYR